MGCSRKRRAGRAARALLPVLMCVWRAALAQPVPLDVVVSVTDPGGQPLPGQAVRLVLGRAEGWRSPAAGTRFVTGADGSHRFSTLVELGTRTTWRPLAFTGVSLPQRGRFLPLAAELPAAPQRWLYTLELDHFTSDDASRARAPGVWSRGAAGDFTVEGQRRDDGGFTLPELGGLALNVAPYVATQAALFPAAADPARPGPARWTLHLVWQRQAQAVRRD